MLSCRKSPAPLCACRFDDKGSCLASETKLRPLHPRCTAEAQAVSRRCRSRGRRQHFKHLFLGIGLLSAARCQPVRPVPYAQAADQGHTGHCRCLNWTAAEPSLYFRYRARQPGFHIRRTLSRPLARRSPRGRLPLPVVPEPALAGAAHLAAPAGWPTLLGAALPPPDGLRHVGRLAAKDEQTGEELCWYARPSGDPRVRR